MARLQFLIPGVILIGCTVLPVPSAEAVDPARPNIVILVSDDHGWGDIGWNSGEVRTPHIDRLAREGLRLDRFYVNPICSVTRAALMTGVATLRTGVNNRTGLPLEYRVLPQVFRDAGYQTWMFGKWHLGGSEDNALSGPEFLPHNRGFDYFYGHLHGAIDYYTHERKHLGKLDWQRNGTQLREAGFSTDLLVDDAIRMIGLSEPSRPFLVYLAFNAVHGPLQSPPSAPDLIKRDRRSLLLANVTHMDNAIGRLLAAIDEEGLRNNTLVLFFGDNGGQLSQGASNGTLRGEKGATFEGGIRVPAAMRWSGVLEPGTVSEQFFSVMDVFPTLCGAAGLETGVERQLDGLNLWPALVEGEIAAHPAFVIGNKDVTCIDAPWKLILGGSTAPLLFNILEDPGEKHDVADRYPEKVVELTRHVVSMGGIPKGAGPGRTKDDKSGGKRRNRSRISD